MAKRTLTKIIRSHDAIPTHKEKVNGKMVQRYRYEKRDVPFPPMPRKEVTVKCGNCKAGHTVLVSEGQTINPARICKNSKKSL